MRKLSRYCLFALLTVTVVALLTEAILGIVFSFKDRHLEPMAVHDYPYLYFMFDSTGGLNAHGFKTNYPLKKQFGKFRIILTGGSVARGKLPEESIARYLEQELNTRFQTGKIEVINAGVSAFVAEQEFILTQLILRHYEPNMILSLDGYNDLMTFKINRQYPSGFELPPHNWQDFRVIADNRMRQRPFSRLPLFFRNISRAVRYLQRQQFENNFRWQTLTDDKLRPISERYWQIIGDTYDFCRAKKIGYYNFLQPVRFYGVNDTTSQLKTLSRLYNLIEAGIHEKPYAFSLTAIFKDMPEIFTDDCHVTAEGNRIIAQQMAERISNDVQAWLEN
ncbi:MAG TPA: hypothetical protein VNJ07_06220 [Chitinophagales bacterium]|nr:hypothetical protein [Chitinophagales bacterium]